MLASTPGNPLAPHAERAGFQFATHQRDDVGFAEVVLQPYAVEWNLISPCHLDDAGYVGDGKGSSGLCDAEGWHEGRAYSQCTHDTCVM